MWFSEALGELFPYVCAIYIFDSFAYLRPGWVSLTISLGRASISLSTGLALPGLLPWRRAYLLSHRDFLPGSKSAFFLRKDSSRAPVYRASDYIELHYESIASPEPSGQSLMLGPQRAAVFPSALQAQRTASLLRHLHDRDKADRLAAVQAHLKERFDRKALEEKQRLHKRPMSIISLLCASGFIILFVLLPLALYTGLRQYLGLGIILAVLAVVLAFTLVLSAYHFHTRISGSLSGTMIFMLPFVLLPISAPLLASALRRQAYADTDILCLASAFMPGEKFRNAALDEYRKLSLSLETSQEPPVNTAFSEVLSLRMEALRGFLEGMEISVDVNDKQPVRNDPVAGSYCPSCRSEYRNAEGLCIDCGVRLRKF